MQEVQHAEKMEKILHASCFKTLILYYFELSGKSNNYCRNTWGLSVNIEALQSCMKHLKAFLCLEFVYCISEVFAMAFGWGRILESNGFATAQLCLCLNIMKMAVQQQRSTPLHMFQQDPKAPGLCSMLQCAKASEKCLHMPQFAVQFLQWCFKVVEIN